MELGSLFLVLAVVVIVGVYLYAPFTTHARHARKIESNEVSVLKAERDRVINSLQELDFDFNLGKIPAGEYPDQRTSLLQKGADILRKLDELAPVPSSSINAESRIEKATAAGRADAGSKFPAITDSDDDIESMIAARRKQHNSKSAGFCPKCGKPVLVSDKFCPSCGKSLQ
jgi:rubrerythrin